MSPNSLFIQAMCSAVRYSNAKRQRKQKAALKGVGLSVRKSSQTIAAVMDGDVTSKLSLEKGIILPLGCY